MYIPVIKTTHAEITGFNKIEHSLKGAITPLFELTKDRSHKVHYPEGRLEKALERALSAQDGGKLILDLTSHEDLINSEIEELFDSTDGYKNWCDFIKNIEKNDQIIPAIQIDADEFDESSTLAAQNIKRQVESLHSMCGKLALRATFDIEPEELSQLITIILEKIPNSSDLIIILDCGYIKPYTANSYATEVLSRANIVKGLGIKTIAVAASSFPKVVTAPNYGQDGYGHFELEEVKLHTVLGEQAPDVTWIYSDYGSIHPVRYDVRGGSWVPRIDAPLATEVFYYRYRREDGGYVSAAKSVVADQKFSQVLSCWGREQIERAAQGSPAGLSPAFWISVRSNIHIATQARRTS